MRDFTPVLSPNEPDPDLLRRIGTLKRICLGAAGLIAFFNLLVLFLPGIGCRLNKGLHPMVAGSAFAVLLSALSLQCSELRQSQRTRRFGLLLALAAAAPAAAAIGIDNRISFGLDSFVPSSCAPIRESFSPAIAVALCLIALSCVLIEARGRIVSRIADLAVFLLCLQALILVSGFIFGALGIFGFATSGASSPQTLLSIALLAQVAVLRRAEAGIFSVFLGRGIGGRVARSVTPILLVLQFLREAGRAHLASLGVNPAHSTAILASVATMVSLALLLFIAWHINGMETEIHELSLRDTLTGLYNLRGFSILAEQALRVARRTRTPFSILYLDLDNLKRINDTLGHEAGSAFLAESGEILKETFRNADVIGRIGGDEFAVAGYFTPVAIDAAAGRLRAAVARRNADASRRFPLALSLGHASAEQYGYESLKDLLAAADAAMYDEKRRGKALAV